MSRPRQSKTDQLQRLAKGLCPIHGSFLILAHEGSHLKEIVECSRATCHVRAAHFFDDDHYVVKAPPSLQGLTIKDGATILDIMAAIDG